MEAENLYLDKDTLDVIDEYADLCDTNMGEFIAEVTVHCYRYYEDYVPTLLLVLQDIYGVDDDHLVAKAIDDVINKANYFKLRLGMSSYAYNERLKSLQHAYSYIDMYSEELGLKCPSVEEINEKYGLDLDPDYY